MKLTQSDVDYIRNDLGYQEDDVKQIEQAASHRYTSYALMGGGHPIAQICRAEAIAVLGRREWLSGLARSAFHRTAARNDNHGRVVLFETVFS